MPQNPEKQNKATDPRQSRYETPDQREESGKVRPSTDEERPETSSERVQRKESEKSST